MDQAVAGGLPGLDGGGHFVPRQRGDDGSVYTYPGRHLGTIRTGWVRDHDGRCVFFTDEALNSSLPQPEKLAKPPKLIKKPKPAKGRRETPPPRPADLDEWSELSGEGFFKP